MEPDPVDLEFAARRRGLSEQTVTLLVAMFVDLGSWHDTDVEHFLDQAVPIIQAGQQTLAELTAVYVASTVGAETEVPTLPVDAVTDLRAGAAVAEVYTRPFVTVRTALARGKRLPEAVHDGQVRLGQIAELDLQQAYAHASRDAMTGLPEGARPAWWARVPVGEYDCALCLIAATQRYQRGDLNPIHPACDCVVKPLTARTDPGQVIAPELLDRVHAAVAEMTGTTDRGARAPDYRKLALNMTGRHGELGAVLRNPGDHFTGPGNLD